MQDSFTVNILKIGGGAGIDTEPVLRNLAERIRQGERWIIVHGASDAANTLAQRAGLEVKMITSPGGHVSRYTDAEMIAIYSAAAATVNQQITAQLSAYGARVVGLAGPNIILAERKTAIQAIRNGRRMVVRDDHSGRITGANTDTLRALLDTGITPVIAPVAMGLEFERLNVDGDLIGATLARDLGADTLVILSNVPGLLRDVNDPESLVREFLVSQMAQYESLAQGRMKKKLIAAQEAGAQRVILADARVANPLDAALAGGGTHIVRERITA